MIDEVDIGLETVQTVAFGLAMLSLGFWFGSRVTGQLAYNEHIIKPQVEGVAIAVEQPDWLSTVKTINGAIIAVFAISMIAVMVADYYSRDEDERPTLESLGLRSEESK